MTRRATAVALERAEQGLAASVRIMHKLEDAEIDRPPFRWTRVAAYGAVATHADPARGGIHARHIGCRGRNGAAALGWNGSR